MEYLAEQSGAPASPHQRTSCWYRAATLTERLASWGANAAVHALSESDREEAEKTLHRWKTQKPFDNSSFFADRLAMDALTEQDLLALLAEPVEALEERLSHPSVPDWVTELVDALHTDPAPLPVPEQDREHFAQQFAILQPFYPLVQRSVTRFQSGIEALVQQYHPSPFNPATILSLLLPHLFQQIGPQVSKTLVLELHIARLRGHLHGETPEERFQNYLGLLSQREQLQPLLEEYCALARHVLLSSEIWVDCSLEFVQRLCADWQEILSVLTPEQEPGVLTEIAGGAGDTHRGGHSVMILTFHSGWHLVYKPKSLTIDVHFQELLAWLSERGSHPAFRLLKLIDKATYGWTKFIEMGSCTSEEAVRRFYERQGGYLALLYALEATDFHLENVIAAGEHPMLIDLEALFQHRFIKDETQTRLAQEVLGHSVLRSALLPVRILANDENEGMDVGGLSRQIDGQLSPRPVAQWEGAGTDEMRLVRKRVELDESTNCPRLHGQQVDPQKYLASILKGFTNIYRLLMTNRDELLTSVLPRFARDEIRFVARATQTYAVLLRESFYPNLLRNALKRERFIDLLWVDVEHQPSLARLIAAERADILRGDIPLFTTRPESRDLWTSRGERLPEFFATSSLELVNKRFQQFSEADLHRQLWTIRASFTNMAGQRISAAKAARDDMHMPSVHALVGRERLLAEARAIGDQLCVSALQDAERSDWFGLIPQFEREWRIIPAGLDLYSGLPGILLFLSYLGWITGEARYTALAQAGLSTLRTVAQQSQASLDQGAIGAFTGLGSRLYLFSHLAVLWNDPFMLREAEDLVQQLPGQIEKDDSFDLMNGAAGCIASLLGLYAFVPSTQILQSAVRCGEHLLAHAQPMQAGLGWKARRQDVPLSGFSHGAAGIAWSLLRLAAISGVERFQETALAALAYERSLFSPKQRNWLDLSKRPNSPSLREDQGTTPALAQEACCSMSWSHGAPGIALGRLLSLQYLDNEPLRTELEVALETTIADGFGYCHEQVGPNQSLAHGDCGNLEVVLLAAQSLQTSQLHEHLERLTAQLLENIHRHGWVMGVPLNVETPGLMLGLAGIGYQCLRLAEPDRIPSVLTLAPPPPR